VDYVGLHVHASDESAYPADTDGEKELKMVKKN